MILGIDASNIRSGGGLTHLKEILNHSNPNNNGILKIIVWSNIDTLNALPNYDWIVKETHSYLNKSFLWSFIFQIFLLSKAATKQNCSLLFVPGGTFLGTFKDIVSMSQNMLPFEKEERNRFPNLRNKLRFRILNLTQSYTFIRSKGIIFLTNYAKDYIVNSINLKNDSKIIPHGINLNFLNEPKPQKNISLYSNENPFKLLYVSIVTVYKHQWNIAEAVLRLKSEGYCVTLDLVGGFTTESLEKLDEILEQDHYEIVKYLGLIPYDELATIYKKADAFVFASSCENMPIILIEAMTAGLPIACSNKGPMPEVLQENGFYFDPLDVKSVYDALKNLLDDEKLRAEYANKSYLKSINYTWKECSVQTFEYLSEKAIKTNKNENTQ